MEPRKITDGLHQQGEPTPPQAAGRLHQPGVLLPAELPGGVPEQLPLHPQVLHPAVLPAQKSQQAVQGSQLAVDRGGGLAGGQLLPPGGGQLPGHLTAAQEGGELADLPQVFFQGGGAAFLLSQLSGKGRQRLLCDPIRVFSSKCETYLLYRCIPRLSRFPFSVLLRPHKEDVFAVQTAIILLCQGKLRKDL